MRAAATALVLALALDAQDPVAEGRALFVRSGCVHCHAEAAPGTLTRESPDGPDLRKAGASLHAAWIARWIDDPQLLRPRTRMPQIVAASGDASRDLAAFLTSLSGPVATGERNGDADEGEKLFAKRGCVACHSRPHEPNDDRVSLTGLGGKTSVARLVERIEHPLDLAPRGLMPDLALTRGEAEALASFLHRDVDALPTLEGGDAQRGRALFKELRCGACHAHAERDAPATAPPLARIAGKSGGCLEREPRRELPSYGFTSDERRAVWSFLKKLDAAEPPAAAAIRRTGALGCVRCHAFAHEPAGNAPFVRELRLAIDSDLPETVDPPDLRRARQSLRASWARAVLEEHKRARSYMDVRMPRYPKDLVAGLAEQICGPERAPPARDTTLAEIENGRKLAGAGAFLCVTCHDFGGQKALGSRGPDLQTMQARLVPEHLRAWLADPSAIRPGTRMPTWFRGGRSTATHLLGGDRDKQLDALCAWLAEGPRMRAPDGFAAPADSVIVPKDRPIVLRTELPDTEVRSLAIGFPIGLSLALETRRPSLGYVWDGGFVDMRRKWSGRGDGPADLVGGKVFEGSQAPLFARAGQPLPAVFAGYTLARDEVALRFAVEGNEITLVIGARENRFGRGLVLRLTTLREEALQVRLGLLAAREWRAEHRGRRLAELRSSAGPCLACGDTLAIDGDNLRAEILPGRAATVTLWFVTSASPDALRALLE